jgi:hypothetical protein
MTKYEEKEQIYESRVSHQSDFQIGGQDVPPQRESYGAGKVRRSPPQESRKHVERGSDHYSGAPKQSESRPHSRQEDQYNGPKYNSYIRDNQQDDRQPPPQREAPRQAGTPKTHQYIKNENVISAILSLIKDLNAPELEFVRKEVNNRLGTVISNSDDISDTRDDRRSGHDYYE